MATMQLYNHTAARFASGANTAADTYKMVLLNLTATFDATDTALTDVTNAGAYEIYGNGWTQGGETLANVTIETTTTNDAKFDADDVLVEISGGSLGPYSAYVITNSTDDKLVCYVALSAAQTVADGGVAGAIWNSSGIITFTVT